MGDKIREYTCLLQEGDCLFINTPLHPSFFSYSRESANIYLIALCSENWASQYVLSPPLPGPPPPTHTHTLAARSKSQKAMHCQVELGQYYNSQCVSEGLCVVIHFRSSECSNRARSLWIKCLPCPSLFTETHAIWLLRFNTHERIRALAKNCTEVSLNVALAGLDVAWLFA